MNLNKSRSTVGFLVLALVISNITWLIYSVYIFKHEKKPIDEKALDYQILKFTSNIDDQPNLKINWPLEFTFSNSAVDIDKLVKNLQFFPTVKGEWKILSSDKIQFKPTEKWPVGVHFICSNNSFVHKPENNNNVYFEFQFETEKFTFIEASQRGIRNDSGRVDLLFQFNVPIRKEDLHRYIEIFNVTGNQINCYFDSTENGYLKLRAYLRGEGKIFFELKKGLKPENGCALEKDIKGEIELSNELRVESVTTSYYADDLININANDYLDLNSLKQNLAISPEIPFEVNSSYSGARIIANLKPHEPYVIIFKSGLQSKNGLVLKENIEFTIRARDKVPKITFGQSSILLNQYGSKKVFYSSINVNEVEASLYKISSRSYLTNKTRRCSDDYHELINQKTYSISCTKNEESLNEIDIGSFFTEPSKFTGYYRLVLNVLSGLSKRPYYYHDQIELEVFISDIGVNVRHDDHQILVWLNRLSTAEPVANAEISFINKYNDITLTGTSDNNGVFLGSVGLLGDVKMIHVKHRQDENLLVLENNIRDKQIYQGQKKSPSAYEVFIGQERKFFRPGETIKFDLLARDKNFETITGLAFKCGIYFDGSKIEEHLLQFDEEGSCTFQWVAKESLKTGEYEIKISTVDGALAGVSRFQLNPILAEKIKLALKAQVVSDEGEIKFQAMARYFTDIPVTKTKVGFSCFIKEVSKPLLTDWPGYDFGQVNENPLIANHTLGLFDLDEQGVCKGDFNFNEKFNQNARYEILIEANINDLSGRNIKAQEKLYFEPNKESLGLNVIRQDNNLLIKSVLVDHLNKIKPIDDKVTISIFELKDHWEIVRQNGYYQYQKNSVRKLFKEVEGALAKGVLEVGVPFVFSGNFIVQIKTTLGYAAEFAQSNELDENSPYQVQLNSSPYIVAGKDKILDCVFPFLGKALVTVEENEIIANYVFDIDYRQKLLAVPIPEDVKGDVYISITLISGQDHSIEQKVYRAIGTKYFKQDRSNKIMKMKLISEKEYYSNNDYRITVQCVDNQNKPLGYVRVAGFLTDQGLISLGAGKTNPIEKYYGRKQNQFFEFDNYSELYYELIDVRNSLKVGGGGGEFVSLAENKDCSYLKRHNFFSKFLKPSYTDSNGCIEWVLPAEQFQGGLNLNMWSSQGDLFGVLTEQMQCADKFFIEPSFVRFLYEGDETEGFCLAQSKDKKGDSTFICKTNGKDLLRQDFFFKEYEEKKIGLQFAAEKKDLKVETNLLVDEFEISKEITVPVFEVKEPIIETQLGFLAPASKGVLKTKQVFHSIHESSQLTITTDPMFQLYDAIEKLIVYPHGCGEQTISKAIPLAMIKKYPKYFTFVDQKEVEYFLQEAIRKIANLQNSDGGIRYWQSWSKSNLYLSSYALLFALELNHTSYSFNKSWVDHLKKYLIENLNSDEFDDFEKIFCFYVLTRSGYKNEEIADQYLKRIKKYSLIKGLYLYMSIKELKKADLTLKEFKEKYILDGIETFGYHSSKNILNALTIMLGKKYDPTFDVSLLAENLIRKSRFNGSWRNTHENAWCFWALSNYYLGNISEKSELQEIYLNGELMEVDGVENVISLKSGDELILDNKSDNTVFYRYFLKGLGESIEPKVKSNGLRIKREIYALKDDRLIDSDKLVHGEEYKVKLTFSSFVATDYCAITDYYFGGLENISMDKAQLLNDKKEKVMFAMDFKDDRVVIYPVKIEQSQEYIFEYNIRCVFKGSYYYPGALIEDMYDPMLVGQSASKRVIISDKE